MDVDSEIEFIKKLQSIQEHRRAVSLCQYLLGLSSVANRLRQRTDIGNLLASSLAALDQDESMQEAEYDSLFQTLLSIGKKQEAARCLLRKAIASGQEADYVKVVDLFFHNSDPEILRTVNDAFEAIFEFNQGSLSTEVEDLCDRYVEFLFSFNAPISEVERFLNDYWRAPHVDGSAFSSALLDYIEACDEVPHGMYYLLSRVYGEIGKYENALKTLLPLLAGNVGADRIFMLRDAGKWFLEINDLENSRLFLRGVLDAPDNSEHPYLVNEAERLMESTKHALDP